MVYGLYGQLVLSLNLVVRWGHPDVGLDDARVWRVDGKGISSVASDDVVRHIAVLALVSVPSHNLKSAT